MRWLCKILTLASLSALLLTGGYNRASSSVNNPLLELQANEIASAYGEQRVFSITRNGKNIGTHTLSFREEADDLSVSVDSSITVRILGIPVYRLSYVATELWRDNVLVSASATTTEKGDSKTVTWDSSADDSAVQYASNHWHPGVLTGASVFNTLTGESDEIRATSLGVEQVEDHTGSTVSASHYRYEDDINASVWYDEDGLWLKMAFQGEDGSDIQYLRTD